MHIFNNIICRFRWFGVHSNDHHKGFHNVLFVYEQNNEYGASKNPGFAENSLHVTVTRRKHVHAKFVEKYSQDQKEFNYLNGFFFSFRIMSYIQRHQGRDISPRIKK